MDTYGYVRVSTRDQSKARQGRGLLAYGMIKTKGQALVLNKGLLSNFYQRALACFSCLDDGKRSCRCSFGQRGVLRYVSAILEMVAGVFPGYERS